LATCANCRIWAALSAVERTVSPKEAVAAAAAAPRAKPARRAKAASRVFGEAAEATRPGLADTFQFSAHASSALRPEADGDLLFSHQRVLEFCITA